PVAGQVARLLGLRLGEEGGAALVDPGPDRHADRRAVGQQRRDVGEVGGLQERPDAGVELAHDLSAAARLRLRVAAPFFGAAERLAAPPPVARACSSPAALRSSWITRETSLG